MRNTSPLIAISRLKFRRSKPKLLHGHGAVSGKSNLAQRPDGDELDDDGETVALLESGELVGDLDRNRNKSSTGSGTVVLPVPRRPSSVTEDGCRGTGRTTRIAALSTSTVDLHTTRADRARSLADEYPFARVGERASSDFQHVVETTSTDGGVSRGSVALAAENQNGRQTAQERASTARVEHRRGHARTMDGSFPASSSRAGAGGGFFGWHRATGDRDYRGSSSGVFYEGAARQTNSGTRPRGMITSSRGSGGALHHTIGDESSRRNSQRNAGAGYDDRSDGSYYGDGHYVGACGSYNKSIGYDGGFVGGSSRGVQPGPGGRPRGTEVVWPRPGGRSTLPNMPGREDTARQGSAGSSGAGRRRDRDQQFNRNSEHRSSNRGSAVQRETQSDRGSTRNQNRRSSFASKYGGFLEPLRLPGGEPVGSRRGGATGGVARGSRAEEDQVLDAPRASEHLLEKTKSS